MRTGQILSPILQWHGGRAETKETEWYTVGNANHSHCQRHCVHCPSCVTRTFNQIYVTFVHWWICQLQHAFRDKACTCSGHAGDARLPQARCSLDLSEAGSAADQKGLTLSDGKEDERRISFYIPDWKGQFGSNNHQRSTTTTPESEPHHMQSYAKLEIDWGQLCLFQSVALEQPVP